MGSRTVGLDMSGHVGRVTVEIIPVTATVSVTGVSSTTNLGNISVEINEVDVTVNVTGVAGTGAVGDVTPVSDTFAVNSFLIRVVVNKYYIGRSSASDSESY